MALATESTAFVVFDNLNQIASVDVSLKRSRRNALWPAPSLGAGFEDVAADAKPGSTFALIESVEDTDGVLRGFVAEYDPERRLRHCTRLAGRFQSANKGFEGLAHRRHQGREHLYALREDNSRSSGKRRGRIDVLCRATGGPWKLSRSIDLPKDARFKDYSALAIRKDRIAIVSQESARLWVARLDARDAQGDSRVWRRVSLPRQELSQCRRHRLVVRGHADRGLRSDEDGPARQMREEGSEHPRVPHPVSCLTTARRIAA